MSLNRVYEEYKELSSNPIANCVITVALTNDYSYYDWIITMSGPKDSPYKGGLFYLHAHFPDNYPNEPPEVCFITPIYHLNINPRAPRSKAYDFDKLGHVSISTLNWWNPKYKMYEVLCNIYSLFYHHNADSPQGIDRAKEYNEDGGYKYFEKAKYFTIKFNLGNKFDRTVDWDFNIEA